MVMSFCKKSVHALLGLTTSIDTTTNTTTAFTDKLPCHHHQHISSSLAGGLGLISAAGGGDIQRCPNVLESSSVKSTPPSSPPPAAAAAAPMMMMMMKDPHGIGFIDDIGGGVDGLMSCTESLGFESSDERRFDDKIEEEINGNESSNDGFQRRTISTRMKWRKEGGEVKKFPPPLSSMTRNGQRNFFFRAVRKDGRLELTEVRIDRTEILHASRQDGRLRLHLIRDDHDIQDCIDDDQEEETVVEEEEEEEEEEEVVEEEEEEVVEEEEAEKVNGVEEDSVEEVKDEEGSGEWKFPATGDGFIRCHELASHHHNHHQHHSHHQHNLHIWRQHCVTTG